MSSPFSSPKEVTLSRRSLWIGGICLVIMTSLVTLAFGQEDPDVIEVSASETTTPTVDLTTLCSSYFNLQGLREPVGQDDLADAIHGLVAFAQMAAQTSADGPTGALARAARTYAAETIVIDRYPMRQTEDVQRAHEIIAGSCEAYEDEHPPASIEDLEITPPSTFPAYEEDALKGQVTEGA